eukprot:TRINITY_DN16567_c0_g2_i2.p1 TRINITY_DN16567_c0_g2~~TRINITY_DN16567_c0_g2_i2.p1  ORF type:complete len:591 (-),score=120.56 TRINITY_DN16567_c0_g2_i2:177-1949(-)
MSLKREGLDETMPDLPDVTLARPIPNEYGECESVRDIEKEARKEFKQSLKPSCSMPAFPTDPLAPTASDLAKPGGFRRDFLLNEADKLELVGGKVQLRPDSWTQPMRLPVKAPIRDSSFLGIGMAISRTFLNWEESDEEDDEELLHKDEQGTLRESLSQVSLHDADAASEAGLSSVSVTMLTWFKSFVGSAVLLMPKGFYNGGVLGAGLAIIASGMLSTVCMFLLVEARKILSECSNDRPPRAYGEIGSLAAGDTGKVLVQIALISSQVGFACVNMTFVAQQLGDAINADVTMLLIAAFLLATPLLWVRYLKYFAITNLLALIIQGTTIVTILAMSIYQVSAKGTHPSVNWGVNKNFLIFYGTSVYTFEGIAMVLPIENEMRQPEKLSWVMVVCMSLIVGFITIVGVFGYMAFGDEVEEFVLKSLPLVCDGNPGCQHFVTGLQISYCFAVFVGFPLILLPPIKITEKWLFKRERRSGQKWKKNAWRSALAMMCLGLSLATKAQLGNFVSVIGAVACVPLAFVFPAWFHLNAGKMYSKAAALGDPVTSYKVRPCSDRTIMWYGLFAGVVALIGALASWMNMAIDFPEVRWS